MAEGKAKTLTDRQQKKALSNQKTAKGLNRSVRNVLAKPYSCFWPLVNTDTEAEMLTLLESLLPGARKLVTAEDRKLLRGMQGEKMKQARNSLSDKIWERNPQARELRSCLAIGVNDVSRGLEENTLASILISNDADPPVLTRHLATLAATRHVPHIVLQNLKNCTKKCLDFSSLAMGLKKVVAGEALHHFHPVHVKIESIFKTIAKSMPPESPFEDTVISAVVESPSELKPKSRSPSDIYLIRTSKNYRAFQPGKGMQSGSVSSWSPYISLTSTDKEEHGIPLPKEPKEILGSKSIPGDFSLMDEKGSEDDQPESTKRPNHKAKSVKRYFSSLAPLKVKRIQGNPMKVKKTQKGKKKKIV